MIRTSAFVVVALLAQQSPAVLIGQIEELVQQLKAAIIAPAPVRVTTAAELVAALKVGGVIEAAPGTYTGNFLVAKPTTLRGTAAVVLAPADRLEPTLTVLADDVTVTGLGILNGAPDRETVVVGSPTATTAAAQPHRVRFDGVTVTATAGGHRGFSLHGSGITLQAVTVTGFTEKGRDSQAVWINNGPGPYAILDSTLEASGENILVGGADPGIVGMNPSDITIRGNVIRKPESYRQITGSVKNLLELKTGIRVLIENNTFDGNWADAQAGHAIVFTVRNQEGACTWCQVDDVIFRGNILTNTVDGFAVNILGTDDTRPSRQTARITIDRNLFADSPLGIQVTNGLTGALVITNNTFPKITGRILALSTSNRPKVLTPLTFSRNVTKAGAYGITGDGSTVVGLPSLLANAVVVEWAGNLIEHHPERAVTYPDGAGNVLLPPGALAALLDPKTFKLLSGVAGY